MKKETNWPIKNETVAPVATIPVGEYFSALLKKKSAESGD